MRGQPAYSLHSVIKCSRKRVLGWSPIVDARHDGAGRVGDHSADGVVAVERSKDPAAGMEVRHYRHDALRLALGPVDPRDDQSLDPDFSLADIPHLLALLEGLEKLVEVSP